MIYQGEANGEISSSNKTGITTTIGALKYNRNYNDNAYVGYMMGIPVVDGTNTTHSTSYSGAIVIFIIVMGRWL